MANQEALLTEILDSLRRIEAKLDKVLSGVEVEVIHPQGSWGAAAQ